MPKFNPDKHYYGKACPNGHEGLRYRANRECVHCKTANRYAWRKNNPEQYREIGKNWRNANHERRRETTRRWREENRERRRELQRLWYENNPGVHAESTRSYEASKRQARPSWYEPELCRKVYAKAKELGGEVDHVVPLQSKVVCGLHSWDNLQVLSSGDNKSKNNRYWPYHPEDA